ncbi:MAG: hypothetical protein M0R80_02310 [Proteobacteria bacterium]|jgi:hypothetical protein|nr:hypothetical protein [Pseudomonadota bacterium]
MNKKLQERKKKRREKEAKGKIVRRREAIRKQKKYDESLDKDVAGSVEKIMPIINPYKEQLRKQKALAHNMEILHKLEEEYKKEQERRSKTNADLEADGHLTLVDKIQAMGEKATKAAGGMSLIEKTKQTLEAMNGIQIEDEYNQVDINIAPKKDENNL